MGVVTNRNTRSGKLALFLAALIVLAGFQPGCAENQSIEQIRKVAEQGHAPAQYNLARMYREGEGVPQDYVKAHAWVNLLASQNPGVGAAGVRDEIAAKMTPDQIAKAQQFAAELWDRIEAAKTKIAVAALTSDKIQLC